MALILKQIYNGYDYLLVELADPRVKSYLFMGSPFPIILLLASYLYFVFKLGPKIMKNRPAFDLERILVVYNLIQIIACAYLVVQSFRHIIFHYSVFCEPIDYSYSEFPVLITQHTWFYFMLKVIDLMDTVFFVLRKKNNQVTFLHVYHHTGMCLLGWGGTKYLAGGHGIWVGVINCVVHIVMYFYYLLTAWDKEYKKNVWWKKHITQLQIVQFVLLTLLFLELLVQPNCNYPKWTVWVFVPQNVFMIILFTNFYIKNYVKPQREIANNGIVNGKNAQKLE